MITPNIALAYIQCHLKAYYLLSSEKKGFPHEYSSIIEEESNKNKESYLGRVKVEFPEATPYSLEQIKSGAPIIYEANMVFGELQAYADVL